MSSQKRQSPKMLARLLLAAQAITLITLAASSLPTASASAIALAPQQRSTPIATLHTRHGGEHDEEEGEEETAEHGHGHGDEHEHEHGMTMAVPPQESAVAPLDHTHTDGVPAPHHDGMAMASHADSSSSHSHGHSHTHGGPHPYDGVPEPSAAGLAMIVVPALPKGAGGHSHGSGNEEPSFDINETTILRGKGPDPLSYIEWDFAYGIGKSEELNRFAGAYTDANASWSNLMGVSDGRYRSLVDEKVESARRNVIKDIQSRIASDKSNPGRHRYLMILHVAGCILSCFVLLPIALALRAAESSLAPFASLVYLCTLTASMFCSTLYKTLTPRLFPANAHSGLGYAIFWLSILALGGDVFRLVKQLYSKSRGVTKITSNKLTLRSLMNAVSLSPRKDSQSALYDALEEERMLSSHDNDAGSGISDAQELDMGTVQRLRRQHSDHSSGLHSPTRSVHFEDDSEAHEARDLPSPSSTLLGTARNSMVADENRWSFAAEASKAQAWRRMDEAEYARDDKVHAVQGETESLTLKQGKRTSLLRSVVRYTHVTVARSIVPISFAAAYTGLTVYTGSCRGAYKNVCLAHGIKGGIFFWYGLLSFGRYLGAYADMGWAWNRRPSKPSRKGKGSDATLSAEWVECLVVFIYGATNTWMERFAAQPGDPYTVKQVQHISIAVMFWFAGLMGLILETKSFRSLLALPVTLKQDALARVGATEDEVYTLEQSNQTSDQMVSRHAKPPSYSFSFNPFPALVIGVTGIAMAAHHQDYVYEVSIHQLWGNLLAGFSVLRFFTYFFLWLRPPSSSVMPSRPPTEALASFSLACGGLVFMLSSEEVSFVAMRNGFGDFMMILNVTVAIVSLIFCEVAGLMLLKAWAVKREHLSKTNRQESRHTSAHCSAGIRLEGQEGGNDEPQHSAFQTSSFIIGQDDEDAVERAQDEKRLRLSSSPEQV